MKQTDRKAMIRGKLKRSDRQYNQNPGKPESDSMSDVRAAKTIRTDDIILRRFYGAWRALRVVRTELYTLSAGEYARERVILTVTGIGNSDRTPFVLPAMDSEAMVKVARETHDIE